MTIKSAETTANISPPRGDSYTLPVESRINQRHR